MLKRICFYTGIVIFLLAPLGSDAQKKSQEKLFGTLVKLFESSKTAPLQMELKLYTEKTIGTEIQDSSTMHGLFMLNENEGYIKMGMIEQFYNDSLLLMALNDMNHIELKRGNYMEQINVNTGLPGYNGTLSPEALKEQYIISSATNDRQAILNITSKNPITGTTIFPNEMEIIYNPANMKMISVTSKKTALVRAPETLSNKTELIEVAGYEGKYIPSRSLLRCDFISILHEPVKGLENKLNEFLQYDAVSQSYSPGEKYKGYEIFTEAHVPANDIE